MIARNFIPADNSKKDIQHFDGRIQRRMNFKAWKMKEFEGLDLLARYRNDCLWIC